ncbi:MAG: DUF4365 domain-containing protein, partial [Candidatus Kapabacteria bacterium]|nr:DUF4365 domain-containing protein [Candidatus Kapabacteria bacterium]
AELSSYCANHKPALIWRSQPITDIGVDGEIELCDENGEPLAEIIKIQLKSTEKSKGYIRNENPNNKTFTFYAEKAHVEYWQNLSNDVLLVIFDNRNNAKKLYAKKIENIDLKDTGVQFVPIKFHQEDDLLDVTKNDFLDKFSRSLNKANPKIKSVPIGTEKLVSNLLKISFPTNKIYIAPINYERDEVIEKSWKTDWTLRHEAGAREVAKNALHQEGLKFSSDWTVFNKQIITFHDLNDKNLPLSRIVDTSLVESFSPEEFYSISDNHKSVFKGLLRFCLQQKLYKIGFEWENQEKIFRVIAPEKLEDKKIIKANWVGEKSADREVLKINFSQKIQKFYCKHFAFSIDFIDFNNKWFAVVNPTLTISVNGKKKSKVSHITIAKIKKKQRNQGVYNDLRFIVYKLQNLTQNSLYSDNINFIYFHTLLGLDIEVTIDEEDWRAKESEEIMEFFNNEND